jgi:phosphopantothenoylcysteine decarboxylase/phosphopantothenate--cysteine ligase
LILIAPASADVIGKVAHGIADDLLTTVLLATTAPILVAPAMNVHMYAHPAVQENMRILTARGYRFVEPGEGFLACGYEGKGRLADPEDIVEDARAALTKKDLMHEKIIVTAGPNAEPIDPVRFITNRSTGKMGFAMARVAWQRGAEVTLVSGPTSLSPPRGVRFCAVRTAREMQQAVLEHYPQATMIVSAAAVADYRPARVAPQKIKKTDGPLVIELTRNPDILGELSQQKGYRLHVGFALETEQVLENAMRKLHNKNLDMIIANDVRQEGAAFAHDTNIVTLIDRSERMETLPLMSKDEVAHVVYDRLLSLRGGKG